MLSRGGNPPKVKDDGSARTSNESVSLVVTQLLL